MLDLLYQLLSTSVKVNNYYKKGFVMNPKIDITRIVNSSILQSFPDAFYKATGFACGVHNLSGDLITAIPRNNYCEFCRNMFFNSKGHIKCLSSNKKGDKKAFETSEPYIYRCHAGLIDVSAPIIVNGKHIGSITFGQLIINKRDDKLRNNVRERLNDFPNQFVDKQMLALEKVPVVSLKQVKGLAQLLSLIANNIVTMIISNVEEKAQNKKNKRIINEIQANLTFEKEIRGAQIQLKEMELKVLQTQINPHFLYNTLDSIKWMAVLHGVDDIKFMVVALGNLMRYCLDREHDIVPLKKEIENVESYLIIQKFRYGDKLSYSINIDQSVLDFNMPKLLLQPLVENAIKHGLEPKPTAGMILITGWAKDENCAVIQVEDDGMGMSKETLDKIYKSLTALQSKSDDLFVKDGHNSIGLENVNRRLICRFGDEYGLKVISDENYGTIIRFKIKKRL